MVKKIWGWAMSHPLISIAALSAALLIGLYLSASVSDWLDRRASDKHGEQQA
jgi:hypothetical protein